MDKLDRSGHLTAKLKRKRFGSQSWDGCGNRCDRDLYPQVAISMDKSRDSHPLSRMV